MIYEALEAFFFSISKMTLPVATVRLTRLFYLTESPSPKRLIAGSMSILNLRVDSFFDFVAVQGCEKTRIVEGIGGYNVAIRPNL